MYATYTYTYVVVDRRRFGQKMVGVSHLESGRRLARFLHVSPFSPRKEISGLGSIRGQRENTSLNIDIIAAAAKRHGKARLRTQNQNRLSQNP